jgi:thiosulfate dehydrogenase
MISIVSKSAGPHVGRFIALLTAVALATVQHVNAQSLAVAALDATADESSIPGPLGESIRLGHRMATETKTVAPEFVGNGLACTSCHIDGGRRPHASPWIGIWGVFPEYRSRSARVETLGDRINDCFVRSMNGKPLPLDEPRMRALLSYMWWLSLKVPTGSDGPGRGFAELAPWKLADANATNGKLLFDQKCAACHGIDGAGRQAADGSYLFPPLWGPQSFNIGAGMARIGNAAAFIRTNMPVGAENSLSEADALDIAAYFTRQPRPDFAGKAHDWPNGNRPMDAPY